MAGAFLINNVPLIAAGDMSADIISEPQIAQSQDNLGFGVNWASADAVGVFSIEVSNDYEPQFPEHTAHWYALTFSPPLTAPASDNGGFWVDVNQTGATWVRFKYTRTSGTGTLDVYYSAKAV